MIYIHAYQLPTVFIARGRSMIMDIAITRTEQFSGALKSFLQQLRSMLAKPGAPSHECSTGDWAAFLNEAVQQDAPSSQEARERRAAIAQLVQSADISTKISIADCLLFADDVNEAHTAIMTRDQQQRKAA
jgi:hypothetical protein